MSTTAANGATSDTVCIPDECSLPDGPFTALRYHFGMLLGVDDFSTEQRYHRGKLRLHNSWLHRAGIVWGLGVDADLPKRELRVHPGLALDPTGRELHLDVECCMDIGKWYDENKDDVTPKSGDDGEDVKFDGHIELVYCACGTRPVPAISTPCEGAIVDTAYSRTFETVSIRFLPGLADLGLPPYPRLRLLFGVGDGADQELTPEERHAVDEARAAVLGSGTPSQTLLQTFRELADEDVTAMKPASPPDGTCSVYPALDNAGVVLANVKDITLSGSEGNWTLAAATVDTTPRRVHVATEVLEELLCGDVRGWAASGPQVTDFQWAPAPDLKITITVDHPLDQATVKKAAFSVTQLEAAGWTDIGIDDPVLTDGTKVDVHLQSDPGTNIVRFIAFGTGPTPLLGEDHVPFAGEQGGPPGTADDGHDYVHMVLPT